MRDEQKRYCLRRLLHACQHDERPRNRRIDMKNWKRIERRMILENNLFWLKTRLECAESFKDAKLMKRLKSDIKKAEAELSELSPNRIAKT